MKFSDETFSGTGSEDALFLFPHKRQLFNARVEFADFAKCIAEPKLEPRLLMKRQELKYTGICPWMVTAA